MPQPLYYLKNPVQHYAWGSSTALPELLGESNPGGKPMAELWMGAHPKAPSAVLVSGASSRSLNDLIAEDPQGMLGPEVAERFGRSLPFLFKILAAAKPLSIQAHPNLQQARKGFAREEAQGIAPGAPNRNYRDANHKPEVVCALTPLDLLCGFRPIPDILERLGSLRAASLSPLLGDLRTDPTPAGLRRFFTALLALDPPQRIQAVEQAIQGAGATGGDDPANAWVLKLHAEYPRDIGILAPLMLNLGRLMPGEALCVPAGALHTYLGGLAVEVMANSDNVLRGALTPKHVDTGELLKVVRFEPRPLDMIAGQPRATGERIYRSPAEEFELAELLAENGIQPACGGARRPEILFCASGRAGIKGPDAAWTIQRGQSVFLPACAPPCLIEGDARIFRATVPDTQ